MKISTKLLSLSFLISLLTFSLLACDRTPHELGNIESPKSEIQYDQKLDINKSPADASTSAQ